MDWCLDTSDPESFRALREELFDYLERHAEEGSSIFDSKLVFDELVGNAVRHAGGSVWVSVEWPSVSPILTVNDLGPGFVPSTQLPDDIFDEGGRGLFLVSSFASELQIVQKKAGGSRISAELPIKRKRERHFHTEGPTAPSLPATEEAAEDGTFGKESFLRALVVQLAQRLELDHGPQAAEEAVAAVGNGVGGRMEEEYRKAEKVTGYLTTEQMGDLYVRLKHAIDGDFYVIESSEDRIVLGNRHCPFGDVVKTAPALCRMTSSVFGGIAARNTDGPISVQLEERIAVGDPECRVIVHLKDTPDSSAPFSQSYHDPDLTSDGGA